MSYSTADFHIAKLGEFYSRLCNDDLKSLKRLVADGADATNSESLRCLLENNACKNCFQKLVWLVEECGADVNLLDERGRRPLMYACTVKIARYLVEHGADTAARNEEEGGKTVLMYLFEHLHGREKDKAALFDLVLSKGADVFAVDRKGKTTLDVLRKNERYFSPSFVAAFKAYVAKAEAKAAFYREQFGENCRVALKSKAGHFLDLCARVDLNGNKNAL